MMTKELLSEVLGEDVFVETDIPITNIVHIVGVDKDSIINIYELMHKMKEWAWDNGYWIKSNLQTNIIGYAEYGDTASGERIGIMTSNTEHGAVEKICEWILKENK